MSEEKSPRSLPILQEVRTSADYAAGMSALMGDLIAGRVTPQVGNAVCNAGGKLLKVKEMEMKYGTDGPGAQRTLVLVEPERQTKALGAAKAPKKAVSA